MCACVTGHVDQPSGGRNGLEGCFENALGGSDERENGAMRIRSRIDVQQFDAVDSPNCIRNGIQNPFISTFTEVRDTLDQSMHEILLRGLWLLRRRCRNRESNPDSPCGPRDFKSLASANSAIPA